MKKIFVVAALSVFALLNGNFAQAQSAELDTAQAVHRASQENIQMLVEQIKELKAQKYVQSGGGSSSHDVMTKLFARTEVQGRGRHCDDENQPVECVRKCQARSGDGQCYSYGADFCAPAASCASNCQARSGDGKCYSYGADICGSEWNCSPKCQARSGDGKCYSYGADFCGADANCSPNCLARSGDGQCYSYGADICR